MVCPDPLTKVQLEVVTDANGNSQLICAVPNVPSQNVQITFKWHVVGIKKVWQRNIQSPFLSYALSVSDIDVSLINAQIFCTAEQKLTVSGAPECKGRVKSNILVSKVTVTTTSIVVVEGNPPEIVTVTSTVPPTTLCGPKDAGQCSVMIVTKVTTERRELRCSRNELLPQTVFGVSKVKSDGKSVCGVELTKDNWKKGVSIPVKATIDRVKDRDQTRKMNVYIKVTGTITGVSTTVMIGVVNVKVVDRDRTAQCSSVNDPHMKTFDGRRYNNFVPGEFVMFQHRKLPYEVRGLYKYCNSRRNRGPTCNCGAAVRSGDDVITFNSCGRSSGGRTAIDVQMYKNGELTPGTYVRKHGCGQKYDVYLPTGMKVTISTSKTGFINIYIVPSATDWKKSEGLCGSYNGNNRDDIVGTLNSWNVKWKRSVSIFIGVKAELFTPPPTYCTCQNTVDTVCRPGLDFYVCTSTRYSGVDITAVLIRNAKVYRNIKVYSIDVQRRYRRAADDELALAMSEEDAIGNCTAYLDASPALDKCDAVISNSSRDESIRECAEDLSALGDKEWMRSHLDHLLEECIENIQQQKEPEYESNSTVTTPSPMDGLLENICIEDCGTHGTCAAGVCQCDEGWTGNECDISASTKPVVDPAMEPCDTMTSPCDEVKIIGNNFVQSPNLTCFFEYTDTNTIQASPAGLVSLSQVICREPNTTLKGRNARITVSNDGVTQSDSSHLRLSYKSSCESCTLNGENMECDQLTDICRIGGECYARGERAETESCYLCNPDESTDQWSRSTDPGCGPAVCPAEDTGYLTDSEKDTAVIVLAVLLGVMTLAAIITTYKACRSPKKGKQLMADSVTSAPFGVTRRNVTDPTRSTCYENNAYDINEKL